jgi:XisH protein
MARDKYHNAVRRALEKAQWVITHDPLTVPVGDEQLFIDLGAEQLLAAEHEGVKIAVEVKAFSGSSFTHEFHAALGQFLNYRLHLSRIEPQRQLFLAVPNDTYITYFQRELARSAVQNFEIALLVYEPFKEVIVTWNYPTS